MNSLLDIIANVNKLTRDEKEHLIDHLQKSLNPRTHDGLFIVEKENDEFDIYTNYHQMKDYESEPVYFWWKSEQNPSLFKEIINTKMAQIIILYMDGKSYSVFPVSQTSTHTDISNAIENHINTHVEIKDRNKIIHKIITLPVNTDLNNI